MAAAHQPLLGLCLSSPPAVAAKPGETAGRARTEGMTLLTRDASRAATPCRCPEACKNYWAGLPDACDTLMATILGAMGNEQMKDDKGNPISMR